MSERIVGAEAGEGARARVHRAGGLIIVSVGKSVKKSLWRMYAICKYDFEKILLAAAQQKRGQWDWEDQWGGYHCRSGGRKQTFKLREKDMDGLYFVGRTGSTR